ncbi:hypothetical protein DICA4_F20846 [Diutina catenulata]
MPRIVSSDDSDDNLELSDVGSYVSDEPTPLVDDDDIEEEEEEEEDDEEDDEDDSTPAPRKLTLKIKNKRTSSEDLDEDEDEDDYEAAPKRRRAAKRVSSEAVSEEEDAYDPDASKTSRQRRVLEKDAMLELKDAKKPKTKNEHEVALRKAESARRRADYKSKTEEEEKRDTINKLLKRRAAKTKDAPDQEQSEEAKSTFKPRRPMLSHPALWSYVSNKEHDTLTIANV